MDWRMGLILVGCDALATAPVGWTVGALMERWQGQLKTAEPGLARGGFWIGCLERVLIVAFMMFGEYEAIGFLVTAKSILRFGTSSTNRALSEYIILGTLLSIVLALPFGGVAWWARLRLVS